MANEFKVKKGLIVEGSGGTILDIQGSVGQLFSITDSLTGDLFAVSDISGIPILNVNSSGAVDIDGTLNLGDSDKIQLGASQDLQIYHNGNDSYIQDSGTGDLRIISSATKIYDADSSHFQATFTDGGSVDLYYGGNKKLETTSTGVTVTGGWVTDGVSVATANVEHTDNTKSLFGNGNDLQVFHNGSNSHIETSSTSTGDFFVTARGTNHDLYLEAADNIYIRPQGNENGIVVEGNAGVTLYYNNGAKLDTTSTGVSISGGLSVSNDTVLGNGLADTAVVHGHLGIGEDDYPKIAYPGKNAQWSGSGSTTGQVVIDLPGTLGNYDMMYMEIDIYNYSAEGGTKLIIGGHNWNSGGNSNTSSTQWHNVNVQVIGALDKPIYFGRRNDGTSERRCIAIGETNSTWSYGTVHVSKVSGASSFYTSGIDWIGDWNIDQTTEDDYFTKNPTTNFNSGTTLETNGNISASNFSGSSSGTNTGDQDLSGYITGLDWTEIAGDAANINISGFNNDAGYSTLAIGTTSTTAMAGNTSLFDGAYSSLSGTPTIPSGNAIIDWTADQGNTNIHSGNYSNTQLSQEEVLGMLTAGANITIATDGEISATDTVYTHPTSAGNKHIPSGGASGEFLRYSSSGTASWATPSYTTNTDTTYSAGTGLDLTSTTFSVEPDLRDGITHVGKDSNNYIQFDSTNERIDFYAGGVFVARMESDGDLHIKGDVIAFSDIFS